MFGSVWANQMAVIAENRGLDPRIRRTRQLLKDALERLLTQKQFEEISIQDIAEAATVNRATFYDHYTDKFALLQCLVASQFQEVLDRRQIRFESCEGAIRKVAIGVCEYLAKKAPSTCRDSGQLLETAIVGVVRRMILDGMLSHGATTGQPAPELVASTAAWAIYGAAKEWVRTPGRAPVDSIAETIEELVAPILRAGSSSKAQT